MAENEIPPYLFEEVELDGEKLKCIAFLNVGKLFFKEHEGKLRPILVEFVGYYTEKQEQQMAEFLLNKFPEAISITFDRRITRESTYGTFEYD